MSLRGVLMRPCPVAVSGACLYMPACSNCTCLDTISLPFVSFGFDLITLDPSLTGLGEGSCDFKLALAEARAAELEKELDSVQAKASEAEHAQVLESVLSNLSGVKREQMSILLSTVPTEKLQERLAKLAGGVAVLYIGAASEVEMKEKKDRVDDALHATRAAVEEGIVPGGGTTLLKAIDAINALEFVGDEKIGAAIIARALEAPLRTIAENAGAKGTVVVSKVKEMKGDEGFNALTLEYGDLVKQGVITPAKVDRTALQNAASVAGLILTCDCAISIKPQPKGDAPDDHHAHGGHQGMGGMF